MTSKEIIQEQIATTLEDLVRQLSVLHKTIDEKKLANNPDLHALFIEFQVNLGGLVAHGKELQECCVE